MASDVLRLTVFNTCRSCLLLQRSARQRIATSPVALCAARPISSSAKQRAPSHAEAPGLPRWQQTPPKATMPVRFRPRRQGEFEVNNDPGKLDKALASFFSDQRSPIPLSEEVKWLAVTHKSFDHGRRGFNDRLAFLGKRIVDLHTSIALLEAPAELNTETHDQFGREVYRHPSLSSLSNLTASNKTFTLDKVRLAGIGRDHGLHHVIRWKPKQHDDWVGSGLNSVLAQTIYSIVGALALERGGEVAKIFVKQRVLAPLGL